MDFTRLGNRAVLVVEGEDRIAFLQGLISNDIKKAAPDYAIWAGFLTPQGKFLYDLFISILGDAILIDAEAERLDAFIKRLGMFKLRSKVSIRPAPELSVWAAWGAGVEAAFGLSVDAGSAQTFGGGTVSVDPRLSTLGVRLVLPADNAASALQAKGFTEVPFAGWDRLRLALGLPDGSRDMEVEGNLLLEVGFEELGGVDFKKGCFMGQENTTRSKHRKLIKRRLVQVQVQGETPLPGTPILLDGDEVGQMRSSIDDIGLALVRLEKLAALQNGAVCGSAKLILRKPDWAIFPDVE